MTYIVLGVLRERKPMNYYLGAAVLFVLAQLAWFLLGKVICRVSAIQSGLCGSSLLIVVFACCTRVQNASSKVDGRFIATVLETIAVGSLFLGWRSITEGASSVSSIFVFSSCSYLNGKLQKIGKMTIIGDRVAPRD
jgi:hypothetical protein